MQHIKVLSQLTAKTVPSLKKQHDTYHVKRRISNHDRASVLSSVEGSSSPSSSFLSLYDLYYLQDEVIPYDDVNVKIVRVFIRGPDR